jgi:hypothetical protein
LGCEDRVPGGGVVGVQPALELSSVVVPEDADDSGLHVHAVTAGAHRADRADVKIACEDVVLDEPEADVPELREPSEKCFAPFDCARHVVLAGDVPHHIWRNQGLDQIEVAGAEGVGGSSVGDRVGMVLRHGRRV